MLTFSAAVVVAAAKGAAVYPYRHDAAIAAHEDADADITVFDLDTVSAVLDGNKCYPTGIEYVVVNGEVVVDAGCYHGAMAGRVLRRGSAAARPRKRTV